MNMQDYMKLIKEIKDNKGMDWDDNIATLAVHKYLKTPAISDFYKNLGAKRSARDGIPVIYEVKNHQLLAIGHINTIFGEPSFEMSTYGAKPSGFNNFITKEHHEYYEKLQKTLLDNDTFDDFTKHYEHSGNSKMYEHLDSKVRNILELSAMVLEFKETADDKIKYNIYTELVEILNALNDNNWYTSSLQQDHFINFEMGMNNENKVSYFNAIKRFATFDEFESNISSFNESSIEYILSYYTNVALQEQFKDSTLLGTLLNNRDGFITAIIDNLIFDDFKYSALLQIKLALKQQTLEQIIDNHPIINEIYNEAINRSPSLLQSLEERFQHVHIIDKEYVEKIGKDINFFAAFDNTKLFHGGQEDKIIEQQFGFKSLPKDSVSITDTSHYERFVGFDGYSPYYIIMGATSPLTMEADAMLFSGFLIAESLNSNQVYEMFDNLFKTCKEREMPLVIEDASFYKSLSQDNLKTFIDIKKKYTGTVPAFIMPNDMNKYHSVLKTELDFGQLLKLDAKLNSMVFSDAKIEDFDLFLQKNTKLKKENKKSSPNF